MNARTPFSYHQPLTHERDSNTIKLFKGSSGAVTYLVNGKCGKYIRKTVTKDKAAKLRDQYCWLKQRQNLSFIPTVLGEDWTAKAYSIYLEYYQNYTSLFTYIQNNPVENSIKLIAVIFEKIFSAFYQEKQFINSKINILKYIEEKLYKKIYATCRTDQKLHDLLSYQKIIINGDEFDNFNLIMSKIMKDDEILKSLSYYDECEIHGDLTVENIIVSNNISDLGQQNNFILLDPNNENVVSSPVVDFAKVYQSLHSGYEYLINLNEITINDNRLSYLDTPQDKYKKLLFFFNHLLRTRLREDRFRSILFHEAIHFARLLPYRQNLNSRTYLVFYAVLIKLLNQFYSNCYKGFDSKFQ